MFKHGKQNARVRSGRENSLKWNTGVKDDNGKDIWIRVVDAKDYMTEEFNICMYVYSMTENLECLPFAGGWAEQPEWIAHAVTVLKVEQSLYEQEQREIEKHKH